jgi:hypothetical protein
MEGNRWKGRKERWNEERGKGVIKERREGERMDKINKTDSCASVISRSVLLQVLNWKSDEV